MKYFIPATETDPECLTPEGEKLANRMEQIDYIVKDARDLSSGLERYGYKDEATTVREIADKLAADSLDIEEELQQP